MAQAAQLHWYRTESHASPLGYELRAEYRGRTWRMYRLADGSWKVVPTDRPQQTKTFRKPEDARKYASSVAMTNPDLKRNPQGTHMAKRRKNPADLIRVPAEWLRAGMVVRAPEYTLDENGHKLSWQDTWKPARAPTRLLVEHWDDEDGTSKLRALTSGGKKSGVIDLNTADYQPEIWLVEADSIDDLDDEARKQGQYPPSATNPMRGARKATSTEVDEQAAQELRLYLDNDGELYRRRRQPIEKNLTKKWKKGVFNAARATDAYMYLVDDAAKKYAKEFASPSEWNTIFTKPTRRYVADELATDFAHDISEDPTAYDHLFEKNPAYPNKTGPFVPIKVTFYESEARPAVNAIFDAWTAGDLWNGAVTPYFEKRQADRVLAYHKREPYYEGSLVPSKAYYDRKRDAYVIEWQGDPQQTDIWLAEWIETPKGRKKVYPIGAYAYTWQELEDADPNPGKSRRKNPGRRSKNGAGLGALIGSTIGAVAGFGAGSVPLAALGSLAGGTVGGYLGAPKDRKKRGAAGGAIGGALLGPVGAGIGGYVGGTKADKDYGGRRNNPRAPSREQNPSCACSHRTSALSRRVSKI